MPIYDLEKLDGKKIRFNWESDTEPTEQDLQNVNDNYQVFEAVNEKGDAVNIGWNLGRDPTENEINSFFDSTEIPPKPEPTFEDIQKQSFEPTDVGIDTGSDIPNVAPPPTPAPESTIIKDDEAEPKGKAIGPVVEGFKALPRHIASGTEAVAGTMKELYEQESAKIKNAQPILERLNSQLNEFDRIGLIQLNKNFTKEEQGIIQQITGKSPANIGKKDVEKGIGNIAKTKERLEKNAILAEQSRSIIEKVATSKPLKRKEYERAETPVGRLFQAVVENSPQMVASTGLSMINPIYGTAFMALQIVGGQTEELKQAGIEYDRSLKSAIANAVVQVPLEKLQIGKIAKYIKATGAGKKIKDVGQLAVTEYLTEFMQKYPEAITTIWAKSEGQTNKQRLKTFINDFGKIFKEASYEGLVGMVSGTGIGVAGKKIKALAGTKDLQTGEPVTKDALPTKTTPVTKDAPVTDPVLDQETAKTEIEQTGLTPEEEKTISEIDQSELDKGIRILEGKEPVSDEFDIDKEKAVIEKRTKELEGEPVIKPTEDLPKIETGDKTDNETLNSIERKPDVTGITNDEISKKTKTELEIIDNNAEKIEKIRKRKQTPPEETRDILDRTSRFKKKYPQQTMTEDFVADLHDILGQLKDGVFNLQGRKAIDHATDEAIENKEKFGEFSKVAIDIVNLGGMNNLYKNHEKPNEILRQVHSIADQEFKKSGYDYEFYREGGDELGVIIYAEKDKVKEIMTSADKKINAYIDSTPDIKELGHPKNDSMPTGSGRVVWGVSHSSDIPSETEYDDDGKEITPRQSMMTKADDAAYTDKKEKFDILAEKHSFVLNEKEDKYERADAKIIKSRVDTRDIEEKSRLSDTDERERQSRADTSRDRKNVPKTVNEKSTTTDLIQHALNLNIPIEKNGEPLSRVEILKSINVKRIEPKKIEDKPKPIDKKYDKGIGKDIEIPKQPVDKKQKPTPKIKPTESKVIQKITKDSLEKITPKLSKKIKSGVNVQFSENYRYGKGKVGKFGEKDEAAIWVNPKTNTAKIFINPKIDKKRINDVIVHEIMGHYGAGAVIKSNPKISKRIDTIFKADSKSDFTKDINARWGDLGKSDDQKTSIIKEEWIAERVRQHIEQTATTTRDKNVAKRVYESVRKFLVDTFNIETKNVDDVMRKLVKEMKTVSPFKGGGEIKFSKTSEAGTINKEDAKKEWAEKGTDSKYFKKWFSDSKVVDENGKPLVVYHGTQKDFSIFDYDKIGERGRVEGSGFYFTDDKNTADTYTYTGRDKTGKTIDAYIKIEKPMPLKMEAFKGNELRKILERTAKLENKYDPEIPIEEGFLADYEGLESAVEILSSEETALDQIGGLIGGGVSVEFINKAVTQVTGYDGVISDGFSGLGKGGGKIFVPFHPNQIKSATVNIGTFDPNQDDIHFSKKPIPESIDLNEGESQSKKQYTPERAKALTKKMRSLVGKKIHLKANELIQRAEIELEIEQLKSSRTEIVKNLIYQYAKESGIRGEKYNSIDTMIKNAKTKGDFDRAMLRVDGFMSKRKQRQLVKKVLEVLKKEKKRISSQRKAKTKVAVQFNDRIIEYIDSLNPLSEKKTEKMRETLKWLEENPDEKLPNKIMKDVLVANSQPIRNMTSEELFKIYQDLKNLKKHGKLLAEMKEARRKKTRDMKSETAVENIKKATKKQKPTDVDIRLEGARDNRFTRLIREGVWGNISPENQIEWMTGFKSSIFKEMVFDKVERAFQQRTKNFKVIVEKLKEMLTDVNSPETMSDEFKKYNVNLLNKKGEVIDSKSRKHTLNNMMFIYANSKNEGNRKHLVGTGYSDEVISQIVNDLPKKYKNSVDNIIEFFDGDQFDRINKEFRRFHGVDMVKVANYFPISNLDGQNPDNEILHDMMSRVENIRASVSKSFTKTRVGGITPFKRLDFFGTVGNSIKSQENYIAMNQAVTETAEFLELDNVKYAMQSKSPTVTRQINDWLKVVANGKVPSGEAFLDNASDFMRENYVTAKIGFNIVTILQQPAAWFRGLTEVKSTSAVKATKDIASNFKEMNEFIDGKSDLMANRFGNFDREVGEFMDKNVTKNAFGFGNEKIKVLGRTMRAWDAFKQFSFAGMSYSDKFIVNSLWLAKYRDVLNKTGNDDLAVKKADEVIRKTQASGDLISQPTLFRTKGIAKAFTTFMTELNKQTNLAFRIVAEDSTIMKKLGQSMAWLVMPTMWTMMATKLITPFDEPEEFAEELLTNVVGGVPVVGRFADAGFKMTVTDPIRKYRGKERGREFPLEKQLTPLLFTPVIDVFAGTKQILNEDYDRGVPKVIDVAATLLGVPYSPVKRLAKGYGTFKDKYDEAETTAEKIKAGKYLIWSKYNIDHMSVKENFAKQMKSVSNHKKKLEFLQWWDRQDSSEKNEYLDWLEKEKGVIAPKKKLRKYYRSIGKDAYKRNSLKKIDKQLKNKEITKSEHKKKYKKTADDYDDVKKGKEKLDKNYWRKI